jgi:hypothetical protein
MAHRYDSRSGARARRIKGALKAHASMRAQGRTPGDEGRAVIQANRAARKGGWEEGANGRIGYIVLDGI